MQKKILVTDDAMFMRHMLKTLLIANKFMVYEAANGQEALDQYAEIQPDLVLMDITMPVMDGIEATRTLKAVHPDAKIVMCSAMGQKNMVVEAIQAGAKDFVVKPFQPEQVLECVRKQIGSA
jgi:two-component system chemotaxis response regulator CheY